MTGAPEQEREPADTNVVPLRVSNETPIYDNNTGWAMVAERLREQDPAIFNAWLSQLTALEGDDTSITLGAPSKFVAQYVNTHFLQRIKASLVAIEGGQRQIKILCLED
ncbi:DnaA N-terminal domain-containing protein [Planktotalea sp.]|uniref:DnaA N-terminal domain-containing protein n=1 Tax=Planktotalea sp. TaxID=2029877 RepID=UPI0035C7B8E3